jgi:hypothetical protein
VKGKVERVDSPIYSYFQILSTTNSFRYFASQIGDIVNSITYGLMHTNMTEGGKLPLPDIFTLQSLGVYIQCVIPDDIQLILNGVYFEFRMSQKWYWQSPLFALPAGFGPYGFTTLNSESVLSNGVPQDVARRILSVPQTMDPGEQFSAECQCYGAANFQAGALSTLSASTNTWAFMQGIREKGL